jgi:hypothetical protein
MNVDKYTVYVVDKSDEIVFMESDLNFIVPMTYTHLIEFLNTRNENEEIGILLMVVPKGGRTNEILYNHNLQNCVTVKEAKNFLKHYKR